MPDDAAENSQHNIDCEGHGSENSYHNGDDQTTIESVPSHGDPPTSKQPGTSKRPAALEKPPSPENVNTNEGDMIKKYDLFSDLQDNDSYDSNYQPSEETDSEHKSRCSEVSCMYNDLKRSDNDIFRHTIIGDNVEVESVP